MLAKVLNDFLTPIRKNCCRSSSCVSACLCCASANRHSVLSCRRLPTRPTIAPHSCAWQKPSQHSLLACAALPKRLVSSNARESCDSWLKTFWSAKMPSPFVTAFRFLRARAKTEDRSHQTGKITFCVRGVLSPLLSNLYMRRFVLGWKKLGHEERWKAYIVNYADDLVICCRVRAERALAEMRTMMSKLKLTVNESKTRVCYLPDEKFDFLGYTFGRCYSMRKGRVYLGTVPSKKRVQRICRAISDETGRDKVWQDPRTIVEKLNRMMIGWANYFCLGPVSKAYSAVDMHARRRLRRWLCDKHKEPRPAYQRFPEASLHSVYGLVQLPHHTQSA